MKNNNSFHRMIRQFLADNEHRKALEALEELNLKSSAADGTLVALFSRLKNMERKSMLGTITEAEYQKGIHKLRDDIFDFLNQYVPQNAHEKPGKKPPRQGFVDSVPPAQPPAGKKLHYVYIGLILLLTTTLILRESMRTKGPEMAAFSIEVHGQNGKDDLVPKKDGSIEFYTENLHITESIETDGQVHFQEVPPSVFSSGKGIRLKLKGAPRPFYLLHPDSVYTPEIGGSISIEIGVEGLDEIRGMVKDADSKQPIAGVKAQVKDFNGYSDSSGVFSISIPEYAQRRAQIIQFSKTGFKDYEFEYDKEDGNDYPVVSLKRQ